MTWIGVDTAIQLGVIAIIHAGDSDGLDETGDGRKDVWSDPGIIEEAKEKIWFDRFGNRLDTGDNAGVGEGED